MAEIYINPTASTGGNGSQESPYRTFVPVNSRAVAGDTIHAAAGEYSDGFVPVNSGTAAQPITLRGVEGARIPRGAKLGGRSHIVLDGLHFHSVGVQQLTTTDSSHHITVTNCLFDCEYKGTAFPFVGILLRGHHHRFTDNKVGVWLGGDALQCWGSHHLLQDIDMSECNAPHGALMCYASFCVVGGSDPEFPMQITNHLGRAGEFYGIGSELGERNLVQNIEAIDCNWDGNPPPAGTFGVAGLGAGQIFKVGGTGLIFRNVIIRGARKLGAAANERYAATLQIANFIFGSAANERPVTVARNGRYYKLIIENNDLHAFAITYNPDLAYDAQDNRIFNSALADNDHALWATYDGAWLNSLQLRANVITDPIRRGSATYSIGEYKAAFPAQASGNSATSTPAPQPLTTVSEAATATPILKLADAYCLSDGNTLIDGDRIVVEGVPAQVKRWLDGTRVEIDPPLTVAVGAAVWLETDYVAAPVPTPLPVPVPTPVRATVAITVSGAVDLTVNGVTVVVDGRVEAL